MACPICSKDSVPAYRPFCSKRCADVDLAKWLRGSMSSPVRRWMMFLRKKMKTIEVFVVLGLDTPRGDP